MIMKSSENEFDFSLNNEIISMHKAIDGRGKKNSEDRDKVRKWKRIIDSENDNDTAKDIESSEWTTWTKSENILWRKFVSDKKIVKLQISSDTKKPLNFFKLFSVMNSLMKCEIYINYATKKLEGKYYYMYLIWRIWHDIIEEFWRFIGIIINMGTMALANLVKY